MNEFNIFSEVLHNELNKYVTKERAEEIIIKWKIFINHLGKINGKCLTLIRQFWYKIPTIVRDSFFFKDKVVFDVGAMCGLTSFLMLEVGNAKKVYALDHYSSWCNCGKKAFFKIGYDESKIEFLNISINDFLSSDKLLKQENSLLYLSDMLYQIEKNKSDLNNLKSKLEDFDVILCHSRELNTKWERNKHLNSLGHYNNIYEFLINKSSKTYFPHNIDRVKQNVNNNSGKILYPQTERLDAYTQYSFDSYVTIIRENNESTD